MPNTPPPPDDVLCGFLLGTLPAERAEEVKVWLAADPAHAARLDRLSATDTLTDALADRRGSAAVPDAAVERVAGRVVEALRSADAADTPRDAGHSATVAQSGPPTRPPPTAWPARVGQFRLIRELGHGGMGYVFEAEDEKLGRRVAVKVLTPELARRADATARFLRKARAAAAVEHENMVPILHVGEDGGAPYIVMPLLKGESLADRLKRDGRFPVGELARLGRDIAAGLGAAHARGLVHRDLKPANVWLDAGTGRARVLDFGLARQGDGGDALTEAGALLGTPAYMAPEALDGHPATPRSDLFALGAVLYECATGARAFDGPTITAILKAVSDHHPPAPAEANPDVPAALSALIVRLLAKNPAARPESAAEVADALAGGPVLRAADEPTADWSGRAAPPAPEKARPRRQFQIGCVLTVSLGVAVVLAVFALQTRPPAHEVAQERARSEPFPEGRSKEPPTKSLSPTPARYRGKVDVLVARADGTGKERLLRLNEAGALPLKSTDKFRIEAEVDPPAYLYVVWVDPDHDVTPVYPWSAKDGWGSRPAAEEPVGAVSLPPNKANRYTAPRSKPGVATMVMFARATPLDVPDDAVERWFKELPEVALPPGGDGAAVWFDNYAEVKELARLRTFGEVGSDDALARWQGQLQKSLGDKASFQTAVSFARTGNNK